MDSDILWLPGMPGFNETMYLRTPDFYRESMRQGKNVALVIDCDTGLYREATKDELIEYFEGGEYDIVEERQSNHGYSAMT